MTSCIVQKFGGTSVATLERINKVAEIVAENRAQNKNIVVIVSAMAGVTNKFVEYVQNLNASEGDPEYDQVVSSGELVTAGLLAIALKNKGISARSYASWQVPIFTDDRYGQAKIKNIDAADLKKKLEEGIVPVVCGFQGVSSENRTTTLGRGGSDLTAVAVAAALNAELCEIYSDVDGVYTVDPNIYPNARKIESVNYREMLIMAAQGAKILQEQSVSYAMEKNVIVRVASSFVKGSGTIISGNASAKSFCGIAVTHHLSHLRISYEKIEDRAEILDLLKKNSINYEIYKNHCPKKVKIILDKRREPTAIALLKNCKFVSDVKPEVSRKHLSRISVIGKNCSEESREQMVNLLKNNKIYVLDGVVYDYQIDLLVASNQLIEAISFLHKYCGLDQ